MGDRVKALRRENGYLKRQLNDVQKFISSLQSLLSILVSLVLLLLLAVFSCIYFL